MAIHKRGLALCLVLLQCAIADARAAQPGAPSSAQAITRAGDQASTVAPAEYFTGRVRIDPLWPADKEINATGNLVTFEPSARTVWHTHPQGQRLMVTSGMGLTQEWGKPIQVIRPGDVVWIPAGVKHWHGASPSTAMTHLAVSGSTAKGQTVTWMEKVTDAQYKMP